ncbi:MAG: hypothetical protein ABFQ53_04060 [Patescibacteria group bacterium]
MKYIDKVYGEIEIVDDVVIEIMNSPQFQRLKGVDQAGYFDVYFPGTKHSRFEHSVGCYILLGKFGASREERILGLIHDMSHSAFSHTADYVFESGRGADHNYQDDIFVDFMCKTDIVEILKKYNLESDYIFNESNFPLQETELPDLCADRIDYSLRGAIHYEGKTREDMSYFLEHLTIIDNKWVFDDLESALKYAQLFRDLNNVFYSNKETAAMFSRTSEWIKYAADEGYIEHKDLFATDNEVIEQINKNLIHDKTLQKLWDNMNNPHIDICDKSEVGCEEVIVKSRIVDPLFLNEAKEIKRISEIDEKWEKIIEKDMQPKKHFLKK